jgi:hypothetical protein
MLAQAGNAAAKSATINVLMRNSIAKRNEAIPAFHADQRP